jgi:hypothetical protein
MKIRLLPLLCFALIALSGLAQPGATLSISRTGGSVQTSWADPGGVLQQADLLEGPWDLVPVLSPYSLSPTNHAKFFRLIHGAGGDIVGSLSLTVPSGPVETEARIPGISVYLVNLATFVPSGRATTDVNWIFILSSQPPGHYAAALLATIRQLVSTDKARREEPFGIARKRSK